MRTHTPLGLPSAGGRRLIPAYPYPSSFSSSPLSLQLLIPSPMSRRHKSFKCPHYIYITCPHYIYITCPHCLCVFLYIDIYNSFTRRPAPRVHSRSARRCRPSPSGPPPVCVLVPPFSVRASSACVPRRALRAEAGGSGPRGRPGARAAREGTMAACRRRRIGRWRRAGGGGLARHAVAPPASACRSLPAFVGARFV